MPLHLVGDNSETLITRFVAICFDVTSDNGDISQIREKVLDVLPLYLEPLIHLYKMSRAHLLKHTIIPYPPNIDLSEFGRDWNKIAHYLVPAMVPRNTPAAPDEMWVCLKSHFS